jgi:ribosome-associated toxin RatA of RatAB toxin-antitoxin module
MGKLEGSRTVEIDAAIEHCWEIAADIERAPDWQDNLREVEVLEHDEEGRALLCETVSHTKVKDVRAHLRFTYTPHEHIDWVQEQGEVKSLEGHWRFEELGPGRTRATYALEVDPGRVLGMLLRGPVQHRVRDLLLDGFAEGLKAEAEKPA